MSLYPQSLMTMTRQSPYGVPICRLSLLQPLEGGRSTDFFQISFKVLQTYHK